MWKKEEFPPDAYFSDDKLFAVIQKEEPWYADFVNYLAIKVLLLYMNYQCKKMLFSDLKHYYWDVPFFLREASM